MKQEIKTFGSESCKHRDLPKQDTWPFVRDNRKKTGKVLVSCKHRPYSVPDHNITRGRVSYVSLEYLPSLGRYILMGYGCRCFMPAFNQPFFKFFFRSLNIPYCTWQIFISPAFNCFFF